MAVPFVLSQRIGGDATVQTRWDTRRGPCERLMHGVFRHSVLASRAIDMGALQLAAVVCAWPVFWEPFRGAAREVRMYVCVLVFFPVLAALRHALQEVRCPSCRNGIV
jgi:hypothetical protein